MPDQPLEQSCDAAAVADYIAEMLANLAVMARGQGWDTLVYLLEMARLEAQTITDMSRDWHADHTD